MRTEKQIKADLDKVFAAYDAEFAKTKALAAELDSRVKGMRPKKNDDQATRRQDHCEAIDLSSRFAH